MSRQKREIFNLINSTCSHLTAEEIFFEVRKVIPSISLSTVYRNLNVLVQENKIKCLKISDSKSVYDRSVINHAHLISDESGEITDVFSDKINSLINELSDGKATSFDLIIHY